MVDLEEQSLMTEMRGCLRTGNGVREREAKGGSSSPAGTFQV